MVVQYVLIALLLNLLYTFASFEVDIFKAGYNYFSELNISTNDGSYTYHTILDTGNPSFLNPSSLYIIQYNNRNHTSKYNYSAPALACGGLQEDTYYPIQFLGLVNYTTKKTTCPTQNGIASMENTVTKVKYNIFSKFKVPSNGLYNWSSATGDVGLAYCLQGAGNNCNMSYFQKVLLNTSTSLTETSLFGNKTFFPKYFNVSKPLIFGLDFQRNEITTSSGSMQLGQIKNVYSSTLTWTPPIYKAPVYHKFSIKELSICGVNLLYNWSTNWPVMVDTGSVCLNLPQEIYDSTISWLNTSVPLTSTSNLPGFTFKLSDASNSSLSTKEFYIPLGNLILENNTSISASYGAPRVKIDGKFHHLCIIRSGRINTDNSQGRLTLTPIIFGTLPLQSLYFAADFASGHIGLSSKVTNNEITNMKSNNALKMCKSPTVCKGDEKFVYNYNSCGEPSCSHYVFMTVDSSTRECVFSSTALFFGLLFIFLTILLELMSFCIVQYSTYEFLTNTSELDDDADDEVQKTLKLRDAKKIDIFTVFFGRNVCLCVDRFLRS